MSVGNIGYSEGRAAPASFKAELGHKYRWFVDGKTYKQTGVGVNNKWVLIDDAAPLYKSYIATLEQPGTNAPVANVIENTLGGTLFWKYLGVGKYSAVLSNAFPIEADTHILVGCHTAEGAKAKITAFWGDPNTIFVYTYSDLTQDKYGDGILSNTAIEIKVKV